VTMVFARRDFLHLTLGAVACASVLSAALALDYPTRLAARSERRVPRARRLMVTR